MFDQNNFSIALDPIIRLDGTLLYAEALCRPKINELYVNLESWFVAQHKAGRANQIDLIMANKVSKLVPQMQLNCGINITPSTAIFHGHSLLDHLHNHRTQTIIEIVEWDSPLLYRDERFFKFIELAKSLGFKIMLDDVGSGGFNDIDIVKALKSDGLKTHLKHIEFALSALLPNQELIIEYVKTEDLFNQVTLRGATACQGIHPREFYQRSAGFKVEISPYITAITEPNYFFSNKAA